MANAGYNLVSRIWEFTEASNDDDIGGAVPSGTVLYDNVATRLQSLKPTQALLEQGIEMAGLFTAMVTPGNMVIKHNNQIEIVLPVNSKFYMKKFRVLTLQEVSTHPSQSRNFIILNVKRVEKSIQNDYQ